MESAATEVIGVNIFENKMQIFSFFLSEKINPRQSKRVQKWKTEFPPIEILMRSGRELKDNGNWIFFSFSHADVTGCLCANGASNDQEQQA